ncbi:MAG TPA: substrate-binding domain-containing protein [Burkholderiaceae bacterium]|nr:substrate-binding domain-containing protein [Burkholderiaceae bacterium]
MTGPPTVELRIISSMATRQLLADLVNLYEATSPQRVLVESVGGVDAAKRVRAGEAFDLVVLAANAIDELMTARRIVAGTRVDLVRSGVSIAVRAGAPRPDIGSEEAVKRAVFAARSISYSTGPSGVHLAQLFERWGIAEQLKNRIVQAPPGVPVGTLVARGDVELGFQQLSELMSLPGIEVLGPLPPAIQIITTFSGGVAQTSARPAAARAVLEFMASPAVAALKQKHGMEPA